MEVSRDELKIIMREILEELLWEMEQARPDPHEGLELRPEIVQIIQEHRTNLHDTLSLEEVRILLRLLMRGTLYWRTAPIHLRSTTPLVAP